MSGFAEGFADGFAGGFSNAFKTSYDSYIDAKEYESKKKIAAELDKTKNAVERFMSGPRKKWIDNEAKDLEYKRTAMTLVATSGGTIPDDAWRTIYSELWAGRKVENILEDIDKKGFVEITTQPPVDTGTAEQTDNMLVDESADTKSDEKPVIEGSTSLKDDLWKRVIKQESGGKQTDAKGDILESDKGALGISQSLATTAMDPGFGVKSIFTLADEAGIGYTTKDENTARNLLANESLNEKFGKGYLQGMLKRYDGDQEKALIAYNAGPSVADGFNGDRKTLPDETQGYLKNILGDANGITTQIANINQDNWGLIAEDKQLVMADLGISSDMYDKVLKGYMPELPELKYAWGVATKDEDIPDWKKTEKIRKENFEAFASAADEAGDPTRAAFIREIGSRLVDPAKPPKYLDPTNFTSRNVAEGMLLAAEHHLSLAATDEAKAQAETGIKLAKEYLERTADPADDPWYMQGELTMGNISSRIHKATAKGDLKALAYFNEFAKNNMSIIPDSGVTKSYVSGLYTQFALKSVRGGEEEKQAFNNWKTEELPILLTALRLGDKNSEADTLIEAYDALAKAKAGDPPDTGAIKAAEERVRTLLNVEVSNSFAKKAGEPVQLIKREQDENGNWGKFTQVTGYVKPDPSNPGESILVDGFGNTLDGYEQLQESTDKQARQVVSSLSVQVKDYNTMRNQATGAVRLFGDIATIVEDDARVLTSVASLVKGIDSTLIEVSAGLGLLDSMFKKKGPEGQVSISEVQLELRNRGLLKAGETLEDLAGQSTVGLTDDAKGLSQRKGIFEAKMILYTFRAGGLEGQSGQAMSNKDFDRLRQMLASSRTPEGFLRALQDYTNDRVQAVRDIHTTNITDDPDVRSFISRHRYDPLNNHPAAKSIDTYIAESPNDKRLQTGNNYLSKEWALVEPPQKNNTDDKASVVNTPLTEGTPEELSEAFRNGRAIVITPEFYDRFESTLTSVYKDMTKEQIIGKTLTPALKPSK